MNRFEQLNIKERPVTLALLHYGDHFYDAALRKYNFKEALHVYLKNNGYSIIVFFSLWKGIHSYEKEMLESFLNGGCVSESTNVNQASNETTHRVGRHGTGLFELHVQPEQPASNPVVVKKDKEGIWVDSRTNLTRDAQIAHLKCLPSFNNCIIIVEPGEVREFEIIAGDDQTHLLSDFIEVLKNVSLRDKNNHFILLGNTEMSNGDAVPDYIDPSNPKPCASSFWNSPYFLDLFLDNVSIQGEENIISSYYQFKGKDNPEGPVFVLPAPLINDIKNAFQFWRIINGKHWNIEWHEIIDVLIQISNGRGKTWVQKQHSIDEWERIFYKMDSLSIDKCRGWGVKRIDDYRKKLSELIGLRFFKEWLSSFENKIKVDKDYSLKKSHIFLTGNPGTGKTTVAQIIGGCLYELGLLSKNITVEVSGADLKYNPYKSAAMLVNEKVDEALGGVLFIDEAYSMSHTDEGHGMDPHGQEAIDTLTRRLEADGDKFVAIVAGYKKEMNDWLKKNKGLDRRFPEQIHLEDYNSDELEEIFYYMLEKEGKLIDESGKLALSNMMKYVIKHKPDDFGNAGWVSNIIGKLIKIRASRVVLQLDKLTEKDKNTIVFEDFLNLDSKDIYGWHPSTNTDSNEGDSMQRLNKMVGLNSVKIKIQRIKRSMEYARKHPNKKNKKQPMHFCFYGNPGTGKTTVAKLLGEILSEYGVCETNKVVCCDRSSLVAQFQGQTAPKTNAVVDSAYGGILFIDEIYSLTTGEFDSFGKEARDTLLKRLEDDRDKFTAIIAGYKRETEDFLSMNSGLKSRITDYIEFEDYTPEELHQIMINLLNDEEFSISQNGDAKAIAFINEAYEHRDIKFGNARWVRTLVEKAIEYMKDRVIENGIEGEMSTVISSDDIGMAIQEMGKI